LAASLLMACHPSTSSQGASAVTSIKFDQEIFNFGKIKEGESVTHNFGFVNTGKSPLIITDAKATCGCTTPIWPKGPIAPGDKGTINVTFNSTGKPGEQDKLIFVTANTNPAESTLHLVGEVEKIK